MRGIGHLAQVPVWTGPPHPGRQIGVPGDGQREHVALSKGEVHESEAVLLPNVAELRRRVERGAYRHRGVRVHPHPALARTVGTHSDAGAHAHGPIGTHIVGDVAIEHLVELSEAVPTVYREREEVIAALRHAHAAVLEIVDTSQVVGSDKLHRRVWKPRDVPAPVLVGVLAVADEGQIPQRRYPLCSSERRRRRIDDLPRSLWRAALIRVPSFCGRGVQLAAATSVVQATKAVIR